MTETANDVLDEVAQMRTAADPAIELLQRWVDSHDAGYPASLVLSESVCEDTRRYLEGAVA